MTAKLLKGFALAIAASTAVSVGALAKDGASEKFLVKAIQGNMAEIAMGELAEQRGMSSGVKAFGQTLQKDHSEANAKATAAASAMGVTPPTEPTRKQKGDHDKLAKL